MGNKMLTENQISKKLKKNAKVTLSPLSLLALAACGGGGGDGASVSVSGSVVKGPISNALVFSDLNGDGIFTEGEPFDHTDASGAYSFNSTNSAASVIAIGQADSVDASGSSSAASIKLIGSSSGSIISPATTIISTNSISAEDLATALGLEGIDLNNANPYAEGLTSEQAVALEKVNHQAMNLIEAVSSAANGAGLSETSAFATAIEVVAKAVVAQAEAGTVDLSSTVVADSVKTTATSTLEENLEVDQTQLSNKLEASVAAAKNVNAEVAKVVDLSSDASKGAFSLGQLLSDQLDAANSSNANISLTDAATAAAQAANLAPKNITLSNNSIVENAPDKSVGTISAEDTENIVYELLGADAASLSLSEDGTLSLVETANYEAKSSYSFSVKATDASGKSSSKDFTISVTNANDPAVGNIYITGSTSQNSVLTANLSAVVDEDGITGEVGYQWARDGVDISGATGLTYTLKNSDVGSVITVKASYTDGSGALETFTSAGTTTISDVNDPVSGSLSITGTPAQDSVLTADTSSITDADGLGTFAFQWLRNGVEISGATNQTYTLTSDDVGASISVKGTFTDGGGFIETLTSATTSNIANKNDAPTGQAILSGTATEDQVLSLNLSSIDDADGLGAFTISWQRDGVEISSGSSSTYTLSQVDVGSAISASVSYVDGGGITETIASNSSATVTNVNDDPTGGITITGAAEKGATLTVDTSTLSDEDGLGSFTITWLKDAAVVSGATGTTYALAEADVGSVFAARVSYTDGQGTNETVTSSATSSVKDVITESVGAISATNAGSGSNMVVNFYADSSLVGASVNSFDAVVRFDTNGATYVSTDLGDYLGFPNASGDTITLSGISLNGGSSSDPLFSIGFTDLDAQADLTVYVSDVLVNNDALTGSTLLIA